MHDTVVPAAYRPPSSTLVVADTADSETPGCASLASHSYPAVMVWASISAPTISLELPDASAGLGRREVYKCRLYGPDEVAQPA